MAHVNIICLKKLHQVEVNKEKDIKQEIIITYIVKNTLASVLEVHI